MKFINTFVVLTHLKDIVQGKAPIGVKRSSKWPTVRKNHLKEHPMCAVCGSTTKLEVHHIKTFCEFPDLELEPTNLITLCESKSKGGLNCHLIFGHLANYKSSNPAVVEDAKVWAEKLKK